jgi:short subunit dehydrogenase-like uncharacterized protein
MSMRGDNWMIYGANGYTGRLIAQQAVASGSKPILAGRRSAEILAVASQLDCDSRVFSLASTEVAASHLQGLSAVLNCAGPFSHTAANLIEACLLAGVNYLDLTGEIDVIEGAASQHERAVSAGISVIPAVAFDVVPSDCLAAHLFAALPEATKLELAVSAGLSISPGTAKTIFAELGFGGRVRLNGQIVRVPAVWKTIQIPFPSGTRDAITVPWGDVASAFHTTRIPNIYVYMAISARKERSLRRWHWMLPMTRLAPIQWLGQRWIERHIKGPIESERAQVRSELWGRATTSEGDIAEATLVTPEGYTLSAQTALAAVRKTLACEVASGFSTPAKAFGASFIEQFPGVHFQWRTRAGQEGDATGHR